MSVQHFLSLNDITRDTLIKLIERGMDLKQQTQTNKFAKSHAHQYTPLKNKSLAMIFYKSSTRTRISFEVGMSQLGGNSLIINASDSQLGRGESIEDSARVISSMVDGIMIRTGAHEDIETFAKFSSVPVINALTDKFHPCQLLADLQTWYELRGSIEGCKVAWVGDGNNVCHSWMNAARILNFQLHIATPNGYQPDQKETAINQAHIELTDSAHDAVEHADIVLTDTWVSMGQDNEKSERNTVFAPYQVNQSLMSLAHKDAIFMHCLPAYRGLEVTADVIDGKQSVVFAEAENRLHAQKALLEYLLN